MRNQMEGVASHVIKTIAKDMWIIAGDSDAVIQVNVYSKDQVGECILVWDNKTHDGFARISSEDDPGGKMRAEMHEFARWDS